MRIYRIERKRLALVSDWLAHFQDPLKHRKGGRQDFLNKTTHGHQGDATKARSA
jgi:hypothetical protein